MCAVLAGIAQYRGAPSTSGCAARLATAEHERPARCAAAIGSFKGTYDNVIAVSKSIEPFDLTGSAACSSIHPPAAGMEERFRGPYLHCAVSAGTGAAHRENFPRISRWCLQLRLHLRGSFIGQSERTPRRRVAGVFGKRLCAASAVGSVPLAISPEFEPIEFRFGPARLSAVQWHHRLRHACNAGGLIVWNMGRPHRRAACVDTGRQTEGGGYRFKQSKDCGCEHYLCCF